MFTEALNYFVIAFLAVAGVAVVLSIIGLALLVRDGRARTGTVTTLRTATTSADQQAA